MIQMLYTYVIFCLEPDKKTLLQPTIIGWSFFLVGQKIIKTNIVTISHRLTQAKQTPIAHLSRCVFYSCKCVCVNFCVYVCACI